MHAKPVLVKIVGFLNSEQKVLIFSLWALFVFSLIISVNGVAYGRFMANTAIFAMCMGLYFAVTFTRGKFMSGSRHRALTTVGYMLLPLALLSGLAKVMSSAGDEASAVLVFAASIAFAFSFLFIVRYGWGKNFRTAHVPHAPSYRSALITRRLLRSLVILGISAILTMVVSLFPLGVGVTVVLIIALVCIAALYCGKSLVYSRYIQKLHRALGKYAPKFVVFTDGASQLHWDMWVPYILQSGEPTLQVTTREKNFDVRSQTSTVPLILAGSSGDNAELLASFPKSVKAVFYPRNGKANSVLIAGIPYAKHVFLHHGDGDKPASSTLRAGRHDILVVAGQAAIDRYAMRNIEISREKFRILGRPMVSAFREKIRDDGLDKAPTILYAPTWKGPDEKTNFSSLTFGPDMIRRLINRGMTVIFRPHPAGQRFGPHAKAIEEIKTLLAADAEATGRGHIWGSGAETERNLADVANLSDLMIADVSGTITDYMQTLKPIIMVSTKMSVEEFIETFPSAQSAYVVDAHDLSTLETSLDKAFGEDPLRETRRKRREYYLGGYSGSEANEAFVNFLRELAEA